MKKLSFTIALMSVLFSWQVIACPGGHHFGKKHETEEEKAERLIKEEKEHQYEESTFVDMPIIADNEMFDVDVHTDSDAAKPE